MPGRACVLLPLLLLVPTVGTDEASPDRSETTCPPTSGPRTRTPSSKYCIIGAGPAGVQMGHLMHRAGLDYVLFERGHKAGSFFLKYPVHRRLNSYNRRFTRSAHGDFRLRHDWHSLLEHDEAVPRFPNWTKDFWPLADQYVDYLDAFQREQQEAGRTRYCHTITAIRNGLHSCACADEGHGPSAGSSEDCVPGRTTDGADRDAGYTLSMQRSPDCEASAEADGSTGSHGMSHHCGVLVMADGMWKPTRVEAGKRPWLLGSANAVEYADLGKYPSEDFEGKRVMILGFGNAALETADAIREYAADIVLLGRDGNRYMSETRYVGHMRAPRSQAIDSAEIKSLEGVVYTVESRGSDGRSLGLWKHPDYALVQCAHVKAFEGWTYDEHESYADGFDGRPPVCIFERDPSTDMVMLGWADRQHWQVEAATEVFGDLLKIRRAPQYLVDFHTSVLANNGIPPNSHLNSRKGQWDVMMIESQHLVGELTPEQRVLIAACTEITRGLMRRGYEISKSYDVVVMALGWTYDDAPFAAGQVPLEMVGLHGLRGRVRPDVYPKLTPEHESVSAKGVYFVGANSHGLDRQRYRSSGGFVHGFRFTTRTVFRHLLTKHENLDRPGVSYFAWPVAKRVETVQNFAALVEAVPPMWRFLIERVLFSAASYEMVGGALIDGVAFCREDGLRAKYIEEIHEDTFHANYSHCQRLSFGFYAGGSHEQSVLGGEAQELIRLPEFAPVSQPFHPVIEFWPPRAKPFGIADLPADFYQQTGLQDKNHPSSLWFEERESSRFHFKADRLTDYSNDAQAPILHEFIKDVDSTIANGRNRLAREYHEMHDLSFKRRSHARQVQKQHPSAQVLRRR